MVDAAVLVGRIFGCHPSPLRVWIRNGGRECRPHELQPARVSEMNDDNLPDEFEDEVENEEFDVYQSPHSSASAPAPEGGDSTGGVIPYKNPHALIAYYLGLFSLFPCLGFFLGVAALILGVIGLRKRAENPVIKGSVHAWIGIVMGGICACIWGVMIIGGIIAFIADSQR